MAKATDIAGLRFGRLLVIERHGSAVFVGGAEATWQCRCDCGAENIVRGRSLRRGLTRSCGCLLIEASRERVALMKPARKHGGCALPEYAIWKGLIARCTNPKSKDYANYGGRGIKVCDRWRHGEGGKLGFECFVEDVGLRPSRHLSIDRFPNNDGDYEPSNVRWATAMEQRHNRRDSVAA